MTTLDAAIESALAECGYRENPYFEALRIKTFDREDFLETQIQFFHAVTFFSRPMSALAAKIPTPQLRMEVVRNVWEEHGEGDITRVHRSTFLEFLERVGKISEADVAKRSLWPEVRIFNTTLAGACVLDEYLIGASVMGIIERMFCEISAWIGRGVVENGWLARDRMIHYSLHEKLDIKHSQDFFDILKPAWGSGQGEHPYYIDQGLRMGATLFNGLYEGLYRSRDRRGLRDTLGHHLRGGGI